ncbi:hypothetical protein Pmani_036147 [Petrolisthes manimaculis]|uniref:Uncharacterized protein n=1 Tax=Petrolisthes manimaculis TaxID=1843537 RepID=A0AAE1NKW0_9EUCA|nr:hypothetical protein Pmani_036147 [Petrolisthes manimaculis]
MEFIVTQQFFPTTTSKHSGDGSVSNVAKEAVVLDTEGGCTIWYSLRHQARVVTGRDLPIGEFVDDQR